MNPSVSQSIHIMSDKHTTDKKDRIVIRMDLDGNDDDDDFEFDTDTRDTYHRSTTARAGSHYRAPTTEASSSKAATASISTSVATKRRAPAAISLLSDSDDAHLDDDFESASAAAKKPRTVAASRKQPTKPGQSLLGSNREPKAGYSGARDNDDDWDFDSDNPRGMGAADSDLDGLDDFVAPADPQLADMERSEKDKAAHEALKTAVHHGVGRIVALQESQLDASIPREVTAAVAKVTHAQLELWAQDLAAFAKHRGRSTVSTDDVLLLARRNPSLISALDLYLQERNNPQH